MALAMICTSRTEYSVLYSGLATNRMKSRKIPAEASIRIKRSTASSQKTCETIFLSLR